jgi:hypothetical protein
MIDKHKTGSVKASSVDPKGPALDEIPPSRIAGCLLAGLALVVGVWYAAFGVSLLMNLPLATHRWIVASGDPDFWLDVSFFRRAGAVLALLTLALGISSIRAAGQTIASAYEPPRHWLLLMTVAIVVSFLRGFTEHIAGVLTPWRVTSLLAVCALYAALWAIDRPPVRTTRAASQ